MDCSSKATWLPRAAAFLLFSSPLTTIGNPVDAQYKPALSHSLTSLLAANSYSKPFVRPCGPTKAVRTRCDHRVVEMNALRILPGRCSRSCFTESLCGVGYGK